MKRYDQDYDGMEQTASGDYVKFEDVEKLIECFQNVMGNLDTPIGRRKMGYSESIPEWLLDAREYLASIK